MEPNRREAMLAIGGALATAAMTVACGDAPTQPTTTQQPPAAPPPSNPQPQVPASPHGTFYMEGVATYGTLEEVLITAGLKPTLNKLGLVTHINGRAAPVVPNVRDANNGCYFFHINGKYYGSGSAREVRLQGNDRWVAFDWNGTSPAPQMMTLSLDIFLGILAVMIMHHGTSFLQEEVPEFA